MGAFCYAMILVAACLHCTSSRVVTAVQEGIDCSKHTIKPGELQVMKNCMSQAIIELIIKNVTEATTGEIKAIERKIPSLEAELCHLRNKVHKLEKQINSSHTNCQCNNCKLSFYNILFIILLTSSIRCSGLS